jgi:hypothetical protein
LIETWFAYRLAYKCLATWKNGALALCASSSATVAVAIINRITAPEMFDRMDYSLARQD